MRSVNKPVFDDARLLRNMVRRPHYASLVGAVTMILTRYREYEQANLEDPLPEKPPGLILHEGVMRRLYDSRSRVVQGLKELIRALGAPCCPYCGGMKVGHRVDHFLPRSRYPEFSILSDNLVPCCDDCNLHKSQYLPWEAPKILNPYRANCLAGQVLELEYGDRVFRLRPKTDLELAVAAAVEEHIARFGIQEEFGRFAQTEARMLARNPRYPNLSDAAITEELIGTYQGIALECGPNQWRVLLYAFISERPGILGEFR